MTISPLKFGAIYSVRGENSTVDQATAKIQKELDDLKEVYTVVKDSDHNLNRLDVRFYVGEKDVKRSGHEETLINTPSRMIRAISNKGFIARLLFAVPVFVLSNLFGLFAYFFQSQVPSFTPEELKAAKSFDVKTGKLEK